MRRIGRSVCGFILLCVFVLGFGREAGASPETQRAIIVSTAIEAVLATGSLANDRGPGKIKELKWSVEYTERNWTAALEGKIQDDEFKVAISGYLWGEENATWLVGYSGSGTKGKEPVLVHGQAIWRYDRDRKDHTTMDFRHVVKFGTNSIWGWVVGAEIIVGGTIGGAGAIVGSTAASGGTALPAAPIIGVVGAMTGAGVMISISANAKSIFTNPASPPNPPPLPQRPAAPKPGQSLSPDKEKIYVAVGKDGQVWGSGPDDTLVITGRLDNGTSKDGSGTGSIFAR